MSRSTDCAPAKPFPVKKRCFQKFKKEYHGKWPFVTVNEKCDTFIKSEVRKTVVKRLNWRTVKLDQQTALSFAESVRDAQCRIAW